ncbi:sulfur carrier protein ThiS adenylyltransferase ThiF [Clostridium cellulovorans]|uniref:Thiamine biosynthesis protein ThiF n=1 Tax=Clostridium cellulovorans (strain ATCC 35296 / DSM 3052 / OCM 3 / 743B) TaxID=573061 RepID=D9SRT7_CLOC7|nr:sulfur carrier protein ThiS adenylyltransferase ThiF [Clostridium cellulovorans]ADL50454.1 thiamine biosynthesis protein ThiF [Clostridium cellulovorans 743B]
MNTFEKGVSSYINQEALEKLQKFKIGIAGAGGLGSNVALCLVRSGLKNFKIYDFDIVSASNLNRQFYFISQIGKEKVNALKDNLSMINPELNFEAVCEKITSHNVDDAFKDCDVVIEAFDKSEFKALICEKYYNSDKLLVAVSGLAGYGNSDNIVTRKIHDKFYIIGDFKTELSSDNPPLCPRVLVAAAKQADIVLEYLINIA